MKPILRVPAPPNTIKVELTEGCPLACAMCGENGIRAKPGGPYYYLTVSHAYQIAKMIAEVGWKAKMEFALRGEPTMNPNTAEILAQFRKFLPKTHLMLTTNAIPLLRRPGVHENMDRMFDAGLNLLVVDDYVPSQRATALVRTYKRHPVTGYGNVSGVPTGPSPYHRVASDEHRVIIIEDFEAAATGGREVGTKHVNNHCGAGGPPLEEPLMKRCARPFREMIVRWDGRIALCCNEWRDYNWMGYVWDYPTLAAAWANPVLQAARRKLYQGDRRLKPCDVCSERTYRNGLLPDKMGKFRLEKPMEEDDKILREALSRGPATTPIIRPWEIKSAV